MADEYSSFSGHYIETNLGNIETTNLTNALYTNGQVTESNIFVYYEGFSNDTAPPNKRQFIFPFVPRPNSYIMKPNAERWMLYQQTSNGYEYVINIKSNNSKYPETVFKFSKTDELHPGIGGMQYISFNIVVEAWNSMADYSNGEEPIIKVELPIDPFAYAMEPAWQFKLYEVTTRMWVGECLEKDYNNKYVCIFWQVQFPSSRPEYGMQTYNIYMGLQRERVVDVVKDIEAFDENENSNEGGGMGNWDNSSDFVWFPKLPDIDLNSGNTMLYRLTNQQFKDFGEWLWESSFITNIKKYFNDPSEAIISMSLIDYNVPFGISQFITVGNVESDVYGNVISNWLKVDCGSLTLSEYYGNFADYNPLTSIQLFLPHYGIIDVDTDIVMNNTIYIQYYIDLLSGGGIAMVGIMNSRNENGCIYKTINCHCTMTIPLSMTSRNAQVSALLGAVGAIGGGLVTGGVGGAIVGSALGLANAKNHVQAVSGLSDASGLLGNKKPYFIIKRSTLSHPSSYGSQHGYTNNTTQRLGDMKGFTVVEDCHIEFETQVNDEKDEILSLLKSGIIL